MTKLMSVYIFLVLKVFTWTTGNDRSIYCLDFPNHFNDSSISVNTYEAAAEKFLQKNGIKGLEPDSALIYFKKAYNFEKTGDGYKKRKILVAIAERYIVDAHKKNSDTDKDEISFLNELLGSPPGTLSPLLKSKIHYLLFRIDASASKFAEAFGHYKKYKMVTDSIYNSITASKLYHLRNSFAPNVSAGKPFLPATETIKKKTVFFYSIAVIFFILVIIGIASKRKKINVHRLSNVQAELTEKDRSINQLSSAGKRMIEEKNTMITEMHHSVKNNLQIIISLLNSQSAYLDNQAAVSAINESQNRLYVMALIYSKLYGNSEVDSIKMEPYVNELVSFLTDSVSYPHRNIRFIIATENLSFDVTTATQLGLFLNEAITNALKYAFVGRSDGEILISIHRTGGVTIIKVMDNGIGLPKDLADKDDTSVGIDLMESIAAQLKGLFRLENKNGVAVSVEFPDTPIGQFLPLENA